MLFFCYLIRAILQVLEFAMLFRAILSWIPPLAESALVQFLYWITEPFILPIRYLLDRLGLFQGLPVDISFFLTYIILMLLSSFLPLP